MDSLAKICDAIRLYNPSRPRNWMSRFGWIKTMYPGDVKLSEKCFIGGFEFSPAQYLEIYSECEKKTKKSYVSGHAGMTIHHANCNGLDEM